eukprot:1975833-Prymnesium_polylepis.1
MCCDGLWCLGCARRACGPTDHCANKNCVETAAVFFLSSLRLRCHVTGHGVGMGRGESGEVGGGPGMILCAVGH